MNYSELIDRYSEESGRTHVESKEICDRMLSIVMDAVLNKEEISIYGFGRLCVKQINIKEIVGFNGIRYPAHTKFKVSFTPGLAFERRLNGESDEE